MPSCVQRALSSNIRGCHRSFSARSILQREQEEFSFSIPPARVRALINLYHRSGNFINYDNLSERIDELFTDPNNNPRVAVRSFSYVNLTQQLAKSRENIGRQTPIYRNIGEDFVNRAWSDQQSFQDGSIRSALWGVEDGRPGLEVILETSALNEKEQSLLEATATGTDEKQIETSNNTDPNQPDRI